MIGTALGRYRLLEPLGEGGMGRVYLAEDPALGRRVAIKVLPPEFAADRERRERLLHEARAASALNHPNIVTVYDVGDESGNLFVAMERVEGESLRDWSSRGHSPPEVIALVRQAARALGVAHAAGLVHRDLKPENLMVRTDGLVKILDFGLARSVAPGGDATMTMPGTILGTAPYMSPEQVLGQPAGPPSDVFSLGTLLYELLTARHPFAAATPVDTMHRILHETPPAPSTVAPALPAALDFVIAKALAKEPSRRYANARDFDVDLESVETKLVAAPVPVAPAEKGPRSVAVLPFKNIGGNADLNYLGIGLADAVITRLASSPDLIVRSTSSVTRYESQAVDPLHAAKELGVSAILDASFQRAGERFRATARLVAAPGGQSLWAGKVDLKFDDIFEVQDEVAGGIAKALTARLVESRYVPGPEAYDLVLRSTRAYLLGTREGYMDAIAALERAVALEPRYADAWAVLATMRLSMADSGVDPDQRWFATADEAVRRALELEPEHPWSLFVLGTLELVRGRKREAYRRFSDAYKRTPNDYFLLHYLAYLYRLCNMWDEFFAADLRAIEVDPSLPWAWWTLRRVHTELGHVEEGRRWLERFVARFPDQTRIPVITASQLIYEGRAEEAIALLKGSQEKAGLMHGGILADALIAAGRFDEARPMVEQMAAAGDADMDLAMAMAINYAKLGDKDRAFRFLARAVELGNDQLDLYLMERDFGGLFDDPRWPPFIAAMRERVAQYKKEFSWPPA